MKTQKRILLLAIIVLIILLGVVFFYVFDSGHTTPKEVQPPSEQNTTEPHNAEGDNTVSVTPEKQNESQVRGEVTIGFIGDLMFDRYIRKVGEQKGYKFILEPVASILRHPDLVVGNLEGPITNHTSVSLPAIANTETKDHFTFTFSPDILPALTDVNIQILTLGNNHILNFGQSGLEQTKKYLDRADIQYFGAPDQPNTPITYKKDGLTFAFVGWNQFGPHDLAKTKAVIKNAGENANWVIVYAHWGPEYKSKPTPAMQKQAHSFIDAGADLVIGAHPHVIGSVESYHGKKIYYSLGNFVFDQYFQADVRCGLFLEAVFTKDNVKFSTQKTYLNGNGQTTPASKDQCPT